MAWYSDLSPCDYFPISDPSRLRAVGWLAAGQAFPVGRCHPSVLARLMDMIRNPWSPVLFMGLHECELCEGPAHGHLNVFIPGDQFLLVCPELITHYISLHGYSPPQEFCEAVLACPQMGVDEYLAAVAANGGDLFSGDPGRIGTHIVM